MQIGKIQNSQMLKPSFKSYSISPQAKTLINSPEKLKIAQRAERLFSESSHIDFKIGDNLVPTVKIKRTGEKLIGDIKASLINFSNGLRISANNIEVDIIIPKGYKAKTVQDKINEGFSNAVEKASYIGELIKITAEDHQGRFLL